MAIAQFEDAFKTLTITSVTELPVGHEVSLVFLRTVEAIHAQLPLASVICTPHGAPQQKTWRYKIEAQDGRKWEQDLVFGTATENFPSPKMTFDVKDLWTLQEFSKFRVIRDWVVDLIRGHGVTHITCTFI